MESRRKFLRWLGLAPTAGALALVPSVVPETALVALPEAVVRDPGWAPMSLGWMTEEVAALVEARLGKHVAVLEAPLGTAGMTEATGSVLKFRDDEAQLPVPEFRRLYLWEASDMLADQAFRWARVTADRTGAQWPWRPYETGRQEVVARRPSGIIVRGVEVFVDGRQIVSFDMAGG